MPFTHRKNLHTPRRQRPGKHRIRIIHRQDHPHRSTSQLGTSTQLRPSATIHRRIGVTIQLRPATPTNSNGRLPTGTTRCLPTYPKLRLTHYQPNYNRPIGSVQPVNLFGAKRRTIKGNGAPAIGHRQPGCKRRVHSEDLCSKLPLILHTAPSAKNKGQQKKHDENKEQQLGDRRRTGRDPKETQGPGNDRDDQKN